MTFVTLLLLSAAPLSGDLTTWAKSSGYRLSEAADCKNGEEQHFGSQGSTCWSAKATAPQKGTKDMFPRLLIVVSRYADSAAAQARMKRFRELPPGNGPENKTWPLRAGFRLGDQVVLVTTDAYAFERETQRAAAQLAKAVGGEDLTCWLGPCPQP